MNLNTHRNFNLDNYLREISNSINNNNRGMRNNNNRNHTNSRIPRPNSADNRIGPIRKKILDLLPDNRIKDINKLNDESKRCIICLDNFKINDNVIYLPCFHIFHKKCIITWMSKKAICPFCKLNINRIIK